MEQIKALVHSLKEQKSKDKIVSILQQINDLLVTKYVLELKNGVQIYPWDVEAYFYSEESFRDQNMHHNELQRNRFGKLYFHRRNGNFWYRFRGGVDLCLSDDDSFYLGILIRGAKFVNEKNKAKVDKDEELGMEDYVSVDGPNNLVKLLLWNLGTGHHLEKKSPELTEEENKDVIEFDKMLSVLEDEVVLKRVVEDPRHLSRTIVFPKPTHLSRKGSTPFLGDNTPTNCDFELRSKIE